MNLKNWTQNKRKKKNKKAKGISACMLRALKNQIGNTDNQISKNPRLYDGQRTYSTVSNCSTCTLIYFERKCRPVRSNLILYDY